MAWKFLLRVCAHANIILRSLQQGHTIKSDVSLPSMQCSSMEPIQVPEKNKERGWKEWVEPEGSRSRV